MKDNDLEGKLEAGRTKAKEVLSKAKAKQTVLRQKIASRIGSM